MTPPRRSPGQLAPEVAATVAAREYTASDVPSTKEAPSRLIPQHMEEDSPLLADSGVRFGRGLSALISYWVGRCAEGQCPFSSALFPSACLPGDLADQRVMASQVQVVACGGHDPLQFSPDVTVTSTGSANPSGVLVGTGSLAFAIPTE